MQEKTCFSLVFLLINCIFAQVFQQMKENKCIVLVKKQHY